MRVAITSRIFEPEASAASFRLAALASAFTDAGHEVTVLTVHPPHGAHDVSGTDEVPEAQYRVKRFPVLRDKTGYVRGYVQYLSFDVPLFFRILFGPRRDLIVTEAPPTTGLFVRLVARLRRVPYAYYAADIWSDASRQTKAPRWIVRAVGGVERFALRGALVVLSVSEGVTGRLREMGIDDSVRTIGNGVDATAFSSAPRIVTDSESSSPSFVYAGTMSEWHGAEVFIDAFRLVLQSYPDARLRFIGGGSERSTLRARADALGIGHAVTIEPVLPPKSLAPLLRDASAAVASVRPGHGYDFAFPTKLYSAAICGAPMIYSGVGPAVDFVRTEVDGEPIGVAVSSQVDEVFAAMLAVLLLPYQPIRRKQVAQWASEMVSLNAVARRAVQTLSDEVKGESAS